MLYSEDFSNMTVEVAGHEHISSHSYILTASSPSALAL